MHGPPHEHVTARACGQCVDGLDYGCANGAPRDGARPVEVLEPHRLGDQHVLDVDDVDAVDDGAPEGSRRGGVVADAVNVSGVQPGIVEGPGARVTGGWPTVRSLWR